MSLCPVGTELHTDEISLVSEDLPALPLVLPGENGTVCLMGKPVGPLWNLHSFPKPPKTLCNSGN